jgi:hypothetical protein
MLLCLQVDTELSQASTSSDTADDAGNERQGAAQSTNGAAAGTAGNNAKPVRTTMEKKLTDALQPLS